LKEWVEATPLIMAAVTLLGLGGGGFAFLIRRMDKIKQDEHADLKQAQSEIQERLDYCEEQKTAMSADIASLAEQLVSRDREILRLNSSVETILTMLKNWQITPKV